jgi:hypothetical protein
MDDRRFDALVKRLARSTDRRSALKVLGALGGAAVAGTVGLGRSDAARRGFSGPTAPSPTVTVPTVSPTPVPPTPTPGPPVGCASGSSACGSECCDDSTSMCCDGACCVGYCYGEELCCPSPREYCAENNTCCAADEKCCINGYCYSTAKGQCCQDFECPNGGKCCDSTCHDGPHACCGDFDCPSGQHCTENNQCCQPICTEGQCHLDGCGGICPCPAGYDCLTNGTCAKPCEAGSVFCEEHACGTCMVDANHTNAYCANTGSGATCDFTGQCPAGQFCTILDPPSHCVTACHA